MGTLSADDVCTLVNEWGTAPRAAAGEQDDPYPAARSLARAASGPELVRIADLLHPVFAAATPGRRVALLDDLIQRSGVTIRLAYDGEAVTERWVAREAKDALLVEALATIRAVLGERGADAIGVCSGDDCVDAWMDSPRGRPRRYCSTTCSGRARATAHRRRLREEAR